jgi:hypothetical protein
MKKKEKKKKWKRYYLVWVFASLVGFAMSHIKIKTKVYLGQHIGLRSVEEKKSNGKILKDKDM